MATERITTNDKNGNANTAYITRYGRQTAGEAAYTLLDRSWARLRFLEEVFTAVNRTGGGEGFTLDGYSPMGLAAILEDIAIDVYAAHSYHYGGNDEPGKIDDAPEVRS